MDANLCSQPLDLLPVRHVLVADLHRPGEELDRKLLAALPRGRVEQPEAHNKPQRAISTGNGDDAVLGQFEVGRVLVGRRAHLPQHVAALVEDAGGVVAEGLVPKDLGRQVLGVLSSKCPLCVNELDGALNLLPRRVGHAEERAIGNDTEAALLVDLRLLCKCVRREDAEALAACTIVRNLLEDCEEDLDHGLLLLVQVRDAVACRWVDADGKHDEVPWVHLDKVVDVLFRICRGGLGLHVDDAKAAWWRLLDNLLAVTVAVREDEDVLL
mmetsp:Transcript_39470/g.112691  ORF Transcript_39470/g.112691 Transcript_39470/m.112691 type:complete len:270 (-) Transcript_39470:367-1176(-)